MPLYGLVAQEENEHRDVNAENSPLSVPLSDIQKT
jgi:hypothetical protein